MKLKLKFPYFKEPPKGWHWIREGITFRAKSPEAVVEKVKQHLITNGRPPLDLMNEYVSYVAANWPNLVVEDHSPAAPQYHIPIMDVLANLHHLSAKPLVDVPETAEAEKRAKICETCPHNRRMRGDSDVLDAINQRAYMLTKGQLNKLGYCALYRWDNRVATRWDKKLLEQFKCEEEKPALCWF